MQPPMSRKRLSMAISAVLLILSSTTTAQDVLATTGAPAAFDCSQPCTFNVLEVCGADGQWYQNECIAACIGNVAVADSQLCTGKRLSFVDNRPGAANAESAWGNGGSASEAIPSNVLTRFVDDGFRYIGRIRLARDMGPRPTPASADQQPQAEVDSDGDWTAMAVRCTPEGDLYIGRMKIPMFPKKWDSYIPPWMNPAAPLPKAAANGTLSQFATALGLIPQPGAALNDASAADSSDSGAGGGLFDTLLANLRALFQQKQQQPAALTAVQQQEQDASDGADADAGAPTSPSPPSAAPQDAPSARKLLHGRLLREIIGSDERTDCQRGFPYTALGQIQVVDSTGLYICTGTLIAPDKVLTAGHCVWNIKRGAFYYNLNFAPGRYRDGEKVVNPWGVVPWKSVTVFDSFKENPSTWDVAVVTLSKPLGSLTGYLGMAAGCGRNLQLTVAGYPQDRDQGTCMASTCLQRSLDCDAPTNPHQCDTIMGMSGSPLWDSKNRVRLIHVAGIEGQDENRATTLSQFLVNAVQKW